LQVTVPTDVLVGPHSVNRNPRGLPNTRAKIADLIESLKD